MDQKSISHWKPILKGPLEAKAWEALRAVARDLNIPAHHVGLDGSLALGFSGLALFYAYMAEVGPGQGWDEDSVGYLSQAVGTLRNGVTPPYLYQGFTGIGWVVNHLRGRTFESAEDANMDIDEGLLAYLDKSPWEEDYDLISGLVGFGLYGADRLKQPSGRAVLERVLVLLDEIKTERSGGCTWHTGPELLPPWQQRLSPEGYFNLGLAHGVPGVIALLGLACTSGVMVDRVIHLIEGAVQWILVQRRPADRGSCFANRIPEWEIPEDLGPSRIAWCYGDLGLTLALLGAARALGRLDWEAEALSVARNAAQRPHDQTGVRDPGLCHGAAGNAHLFNRLYQATGDPLYRDAAIRWFEETLEFWTPNTGVGGFRAWQPSKETNGEDSWKDRVGFLDGAAGIGLALLAGLSPVEPAWDRVLLISVPPAGCV